VGVGEGEPQALVEAAEDSLAVGETVARNHACTRESLDYQGVSVLAEPSRVAKRPVKVCLVTPKTNSMHQERATHSSR